jgi:hypothetical protein
MYSEKSKATELEELLDGAVIETAEDIELDRLELQLELHADEIRERREEIEDDLTVPLNNQGRTEALRLVQKAMTPSELDLSADYCDQVDAAPAGSVLKVAWHQLVQFIACVAERAAEAQLLPGRSEAEAESLLALRAECLAAQNAPNELRRGILDAWGVDQTDDDPPTPEDIALLMGSEHKTSLEEHAQLLGISVNELIQALSAPEDFLPVREPTGRPPGRRHTGSQDPDVAVSLLEKHTGRSIKELRACLGSGKPTRDHAALRRDVLAPAIVAIRNGKRGEHRATPPALAAALDCSVSSIKRLAAGK